MSGYEYGNARLRAMKSRLLSEADYRVLARSESLDDLIGALTRTAYRRAVEAALVRVGEPEAISYALSQDLIATARRIRAFYEPPAQHMLATILRSYDVHNLKTILRGVERGAAPDEIRALLLPIGDLTEALLDDLLQMPSLRAVIDRIATLRLPQAAALTAARAGRTDAILSDLELALERWYFETAMRQAQAGRGEAASLREALAVDADLTNLLTVLRLVHAPGERAALQRRIEPGGWRALFVGPGRLPFALLESAVAEPALAGVADVLRQSIYAVPLRAGVEAARRSGRLSDVERSLKRWRLRWRAGLIARDPLGTGVPLGYLALKVNEIGNLRWIARGVRARLAADAILAEVEWVA